MRLANHPVLLSSLLTATAARLAAAHGDHGGQQQQQQQQQPMVDLEDGWAALHMWEEHHITNVDPDVFFTLHDFEGMGVWDEEDILRTYGLHDESNAGVSDDRRHEIVQQVLDLFDTEGEGAISKAEFVERWKEGVRLPDFGTGPGHHGDMETEYELHHWEKYHADGATEEDLTHPEDIEHFRRHEEMEREQEEWERAVAKGVVEANIPAKFKKQR